MAGFIFFCKDSPNRDHAVIPKMDHAVIPDLFNIEHRFLNLEDLKDHQREAMAGFIFFCKDSPNRDHAVIPNRDHAVIPDLLNTEHRTLIFEFRRFKRPPARSDGEIYAGGKWNLLIMIMKYIVRMIMSVFFITMFMPVLMNKVHTNQKAFIVQYLRSRTRFANGMFF
jgi:hypothetical protein